MFCSNCGKQISDSSKFCINCGAPISADKANPNIGASISKNETLIKKVEFEATNETIENKTERDKNKGVSWYRNVKWWVLLGISFIAWLLYSAGNNNGGMLWYIIFIVSFIFSIRQFLKEDYFKLNAKKKSSRIYSQILIVVVFVILLMIVSAISQLLFK